MRAAAAGTLARTADRADVLVMGAGLAGLTAAIHLARRGHHVTCVDRETFPRVRVGESLDWSAPWLLRRLGYRSAELVGAGFGTYKCDIEADSPDGVPITAHPPRLLSRRPFGAEMTTVHLDRERFDRDLYERALGAGVDFVWDAVATVEMDGDRVTGCLTRSGRRLHGAWYIDASGPSRLVGRVAGIGVREHAVQRTCLWTQVSAPRARDGTTLSLDTRKDQLEWAWEIPLSPDRQSIGLVMPSVAFRSLERRGRSRARMLVQQLARFPRYAGLDPEALDEVRARTYRPYVSHRVTGGNWLMVGEAAALIDPMTAIGVTAALRNGYEAATIIDASEGFGPATARALADYDRRVRSMGNLYNSAIESLIYRSEVRRAFGLRAAGLGYVGVGYGANTVYTRLRPTTRARTAALASIISIGHLWLRAWRAAATFGTRRRAASPGA